MLQPGSFRPSRVRLHLPQSDTGILVLFGAAIALLQIAVNREYGFHRDELLTYSNSRHLSSIGNPDLYVCRNLREPWPEFWAHVQYFG